MSSLKLPENTSGIKLRGKELGDYPKEFPNQFPVLLIARLAADERSQGRGAASFLLEFAVQIALSERDKIGCAYLLTHAYAKPGVIDWYADRGFRSWIKAPHRGETVPMYLEIPQARPSD
jgi:GNAT superfamily N-acetyltransferase